MAIAEISHHSLSLAEALHALGGLYAEQGDAARAVRLLERCLGVLREHNITHIEPPVTALFGYALALAGDREKAVPLLTLEVVRSGDITRLVGARAAAGLILLDDVHAAAKAASGALAAAQRFGAKLVEAEALTQLATVAAHESPPRWTEAREKYKTALDRAAKVAAQPLIAHCQRGLGGLYTRMGSTEQARECLGMAAAMYDEMRMVEWLRRTNGEVAALT
jgi:tetratricopeptide (TPR) repeat protein